MVSFLQWMQNPKLIIQTKCLVRFGTYFYELLIQFIVGQDTSPRILYKNNLKKLPNSHWAHKMPNKAIELLDEEQFKEIFNNLENRIQKAFDHFTKWITS
ncbi:3463_t:CDS:2, partial [Gigaspora margarita]